MIRLLVLFTIASVAIGALVDLGALKRSRAGALSVTDRGCEIYDACAESGLLPSGGVP